ncbi:FAD:protein FMN transferase [Paracoccus luteus]|uniref:FAD:protein FMN transferase n=1 Tax=Paracoccus luteus TaxID=2508543 RepID=UPI001FE45318|nr:FAD:protein FMN transferase [Paracoccus luteus]
MLTRRRFMTLAACAAAAPASASAGAGAAPHEWRGAALGADVTLRVDGGDARAARAFFAEAARVLRSIEDRFSLYRGSDLTRLNALGRLAHPSDDFTALLTLAGQVHAATAGAFDPTVQPLWQARRLGRDETAARALAGWDGVRIGPDAVMLDRPGMALTLNGIAQGHAADRLAGVARRRGLTRTLIDTGEIRGQGAPGWTAEVVAPGGTALRRLTLRDRALATSAPFGTRIGPQEDGAHILAADGRAPRWSVAAISAPTAAVADALSTAAVLMDAPAIEHALAAFPGARIEVLSPL